MRDAITRLTPFLFCGLVSGCAAFDGVAPKDIELSDLEAPDAKDARSLESFERKHKDQREELASAQGESLPPPRPRPAEPVAPSRPRPDGPNMDIYRSQGCVTALSSVAADDSIAPRTRALAKAVLSCNDGPGTHDLRHYPCTLFAPGDDDRLIDRAIQELSVVAATCKQPPA